MRKISRIAGTLLLVLLLAITGFCAPGSKSNDDEGILQQTSADEATIALKDGYILINNTWNKGATMGPHKERIFTREIDGETAFGWDWKWSSSYTVVSYPEVLYGDTPWDGTSAAGKEMPFRIGSKDVKVDYDVDLHGTGTFNMAFEFWVVSRVPAVSHDITHEVMIWNYTSGMTPAGSKIDEATFDGVTYNVYLRKNHGDASGASSNQWEYIAFQAQKPVLHGPLDIGGFIDYLVDKGILNDRLYVTTLELGNEIVQGSGRAVISHYAITIR